VVDAPAADPTGPASPTTTATVTKNLIRSFIDSSSASHVKFCRQSTDLREVREDVRL
jgi:hypothetical protein